MLNASHLSASSRELNQANLGQKTGDTATGHLRFVVTCRSFSPKSFQHPVQKDDLEGKIKLVLMTFVSCFLPKHGPEALTLQTQNLSDHQPLADTSLFTRQRGAV